MNDTTASHAPVLIFAYGNPSRGDDALGPAMYELLEQYNQQNGKTGAIDLLTDYQLQIEHIIDLENRETVIFIDADASAETACLFFKLQPEYDSSYTTHAMSPAALLAVYQQVNQQQPPPCYMLTIRGYEFELGGTLSERASHNLQQGYEFTTRLIESGRIEAGLNETDLDQPESAGTAVSNQPTIHTL